MAGTPAHEPDRVAGITRRAARVLDPTLPVLGVGMKMFHDLTGAREVIEALRTADTTSVASFVLPSFPLIAEALATLQATDTAVGAQDVHWADRGAHTGSVSALLLAELGCDVVEIGHAERRREHNETDEQVAAKVAAAHRHQLLPVLCVGEHEPADPDGAAAVTVAQLERRLAATTEAEPVVVAYEPSWAIGAAAAADTEHIAAVVVELRRVLRRRAPHHRVLYGGSVTPHSAASILACPGIDGLFVGRAAGDADGLAALLDVVRTHPT